MNTGLVGNCSLVFEKEEASLKGRNLKESKSRQDKKSAGGDQN